MSASYSRAQWLPVRSLTPELITSEYFITTVQHIPKGQLDMLVAKKCILSEEALIVNTSSISDSVMHELLHRLYTLRRSRLCFCVTKMLVARGMASTIAAHPEWFTMSDKNETVLHLIAKSDYGFWSDIFTEMIEKNDSLGRSPLYYVLMRDIPQHAELKNKLIHNTTVPNADLLTLMIKHDIYQFITMKNIDLLNLEEMAAFQAVRCCKVYFNFNHNNPKPVSDATMNRIAVAAFLSGDDVFGLESIRKTYQDYVPQPIKDLVYKKVSAATRAKINQISSPDRMNDDYVSGDEMPRSLTSSALSRMAPPSRGPFSSIKPMRTVSSGSSSSTPSERFVARGHRLRPIPNLPVRSGSSSSENDSGLLRVAKNRMAARSMMVDDSPSSRVSSIIPARSSSGAFSSIRPNRSSSSGSTTASSGITNRISNKQIVNPASSLKAFGLIRSSRLTQFGRSQSSGSTDRSGSVGSVRSAKSTGSSVFNTIKPLRNATSGTSSVSSADSLAHPRSKPLRFSLSPKHTERQKVIESIIARSKAAPAAASRVSNTARPARSSDVDPYNNQTNMNLRSRSTSSSASMRRYNSVASNSSN